MLMKKEGFSYSFNPAKCEECGGKCCTGESGYIWINPIEMEKLSNELQISMEQLKRDYLIKVGYKFSIKEKQIGKNDYACIFFNEITKKCMVYDARPNQCRTFPFWDYFKKHKDEVIKECIGIVE